MEQTEKHFRKRSAILSCLRATKSHPSAEWIFRQLKPEIPDLSLATVYRNLTLFRQQGLIASIGTVNGVERFDGNTKPHVHFVCSQCGRVDDLPAVQVPDSLKDQACRDTGAEISACQLTFHGVCGCCREV